MRTATIRQPASMKSPIGPPGEEAKLPQDLSRHFRVYEENVRKVYRLCKRSARSLPPSGPRDATHIRRSSFFGVPGIEPGLHAPEACVLPVYYTPIKELLPISYVLPVYYGPAKEFIARWDTPRCTLQDSNLRPFECESNALTN